MVQFKLLVCDTLAQTRILLSKMALEHMKTWQDYSTNTLYIKQMAIPLYATQDVELLPDCKTTLQVNHRLNKYIAIQRFNSGTGYCVGMVKQLF